MSLSRLENWLKKDYTHSIPRELVKIREEYDSNTERDADILRHVYKQVGCELAEQERRYSEIDKTKYSYVRKLFGLLTGL